MRQLFKFLFLLSLLLISEMHASKKFYLTNAFGFSQDVKDCDAIFAVVNGNPPDKELYK